MQAMIKRVTRKKNERSVEIENGGEIASRISAEVKTICQPAIAPAEVSPKAVWSGARFV
jgi:hypothetical protein